MVQIAKSADDLAKRVGRFLDREKRKDDHLSSLLKNMSMRPTYLFGGIIRDIAFDGILERDGVTSDIDIVCWGRHDFVDRLVKYGTGCKDIGRNKFGGYRISTEHWKVDVWDIRNTWAFRTGEISYQSPESILKTTITNWESILVRLDRAYVNRASVICDDGYFRDIAGGYLDVVLEVNPNPIGMYVRIMRAHAGGRVSRLSKRAADLLRRAMSVHSFEDFSSYERGHYGHCLIEKGSFGVLSKALNSTTVGEVWLCRSSETRSLL